MKFIEFADSKWREGVQLEEYKGEYSIITARQGDDKIYFKWGFPQGKDKKPIEKSLPWKVKIGQDKDEAVKVLKGLLAELEGQSPASEEEIPF